MAQNTNAIASTRVRRQATELDFGRDRRAEDAARVLGVGRSLGIGIDRPEPAWQQGKAY